MRRKCARSTDRIKGSGKSLPRGYLTRTGLEGKAEWEANGTTGWSYWFNG